MAKYNVLPRATWDEKIAEVKEFILSTAMYGFIGTVISEIESEEGVKMLRFRYENEGRSYGLDAPIVTGKPIHC